MWPFKYPYTNFHELNLDWILNEIKTLRGMITLDKDAYRFFTPSSVFGVMPGDAIPADLFSKAKKILFVSGVYYLTSPVDVLDCDILCEDGVEFQGNSEITFTRSNIYGGRFAAVGVNTRGRVNFNGTKFEAGAENVNDVNVFSGDAFFDNCEFDGKTTTRFGIWSDTGSEKRQIGVKNCTFSNYFLNAIFSGATNTIIEDCIFRSNHAQTAESGGGQIDLVGKDMPNSALVSGCMFLSPNSNTSAVETEHAGDVTITNCYIDQTGGLYAFALQNGGNALIENCTLTRNANPALYMTENVNATVINVDFRSETYNIKANPYSMLTAINCKGVTPDPAGSIPIIRTIGNPVELKGTSSTETAFFIWKNRQKEPAFLKFEIYNDANYAEYLYKNDGTLEKIKEVGTLEGVVSISSTKDYIRIAGTNLNLKYKCV